MKFPKSDLASCVLTFLNTNVFLSPKTAFLLVSKKGVSGQSYKKHHLSLSEVCSFGTPGGNGVVSALNISPPVLTW